MKLIREAAMQLSRNESGATAVEYGLILSLMTLALIGALSATGSGTSSQWQGVSDDVTGAMSNAGV